jgi:conjugative relaxase-like TrwC/TraI family protein
MLSNIKKLSSAKQASGYYKQADYYTKGQEGVDISSSWLGKGAEELGLEGFVDHQQFEAILAGVLPDGTILDQPNRVVGWDLTFSAPKSVSVMALAGGDERLLDAHMEAVKDALQFAQDEFAVTRKTEDGDTFIEKTGNLLVSAFTHTTSRALDPALHTHSLIMNATKNQDGEWRALESNTFFDNRILLGLVYQTSLSQRAAELGYDIIRDDRTGQFDLAEVPRAVIDEFSQRRQQIEKAADEQGISHSDAQGMEQVALNTRNTKQNVPTSQVTSDWDARINTLDFDYQAIIDTAKEKAQDTAPAMHNEDALNILRLAIENLSFKESVFSRQDLIKEALRFDQNNIAVNQIAGYLDALVSHGELLETRMDQRGQERQISYTTPASVDREKEILGMVKAGTGKSQAMGTLEEVTGFIERYNASADMPLNASQTDALIGLATNEDIFQGLQGLPGVGKSTLMHATNAFANEQGLKLVGIAPTGTAAQELYHKANMETRTIDSLLEIDKHRDGQSYRHEPNTIYVVDESGMVSDRHTVALMRLNNVEGSRMIDAGDINQLPALEAGAPFEQKQKLSYAFEIMNDIKRQRNPLLQKMVYDAIDSSIGKAFSVLAKSTDEHSGIANIENVDDRLNASVAHYARLLDHYVDEGHGLSEIVNKDIKMVTPLNATKEDSNAAIRDTLKSRGLLDNDQRTSLITLLPKGITPTEQKRAIGFKAYRDNGTAAEGDIVRFHKDIDALGIKQGEYFHVANTPTKGSTVVSLKHADTGRPVNMDMARYTEDNTLSVFSASRKEISVGDQLRWRDTYQATDIKNGQSLEVTHIDHQQQTYTVKVDDGRHITLSQDLSGGHNDYNYAITPHSFQGGSANHVILNYGKEARRLTTRNNLIVSLTRGVHGTFLYADNAQQVAQEADSNNRSKTSALDQIGQSGSYHHIESPQFKQNVLEAQDGVDKAVKHLSGQFSSFTTHEIMRHAMRFSGKDSASVREAIKGYVKDNTLIQVKTDERHETYYTSKAIIEQEKALRAGLKAAAVPIKVSDKQFDDATLRYGMFDENRDIAKHMLASPSQVVILNAKQNSETTLFNHALTDILASQKKRVTFVAPNNQAAHAERLGYDVMTVAQLAKSEKPYDMVVMLDAHNASAKALNKVFETVEGADSKVVLEGLTAISQEFAHKDALSNLAKSAKKQNQFYDLMSQASYTVDILAKQAEQQIPTNTKRELEREANVIPSETDRHAAIVNTFLSGSRDASIIGASKEGSQKMSDMVRGALKGEGHLKNAQSHDTLAAVFMSPQQKQIASEYQVGQVILFNRKGERDGFTRQESYVVEKIDPQTNTLVLRSASGTRTVSIHELKSDHFSVNDRTTTEIGKGEKIRFSTGVFDQKIPANADGRVIDIDHDKKTLQVELNSGRKVELDLTKQAHQFITHGYTQSMNQSTKMPMRNQALIELDGRFKSSANVQSFLKALSTAKQTVSLYADKRSTLTNYLNPSQDKARSIDELLQRDSQRATAESKAQSITHERSNAYQQEQRNQHENEHQRTQQRER